MMTNNKTVKSAPLDYLASYWQLLLPMLWVGMVLAISFMEAPLKFQAPGITIPLGLGIGRLVFFALNIAEAVCLASLLLVSLGFKPVRVTGKRLAILLTVAGIYAAKVLVVRPPLNARTDMVLAGAEPGQSPWHYIYMVADFSTIVLLVMFALLTVGWLRAAARQRHAG